MSLRCRLLVCLCLGLLAAPLDPGGPAPAQAIERRKPQFLTEPAYLVLPFPYDLPGIGSGIAWTGLLANALGTHADAFAIVATGDAAGEIFGLEDLHLIRRRLILDLFSLNLDKAAVNSYETRGMDSSADDFRLLEASEVDNRSAVLRLTLFQRRLEAFVGWEEFRSAIVRVREPDGRLIVAFAEPFRQRRETHSAGVQWDYTDDFNDPRRGVRISVRAERTPPDDADAPDFIVWSYSLSGYLPLGRISTLTLNYFQSDADVRRKGNTDRADVAADVGLDCAPTDTACLAVQARLVAEQIAARSNGTATALGGQDRLRAYPRDRFQGAHTRFLGAELRWNLTEEVTPFDYLIWKDVRTNVQLAFFAETGSVGETRDEVGDRYRNAYGFGLRLVSGSGFVYRADVATGDEGTETTLFFNYPY